jgi:hypothetical protein
MMKRKIRLLMTAKIVGVIMTASLLQSCINKDDFDFDKIAETAWNPNVSLPLVHSALSIKDVLHLADTGAVVIDNTNFVTVVYKGNIYSVYGYEFLPLIDQADNQNINLTLAQISTLAISDTVSTDRNIVYPFGVANAEHIDSMLLSHGTFNINVSSVIRHSGVLTVTLPTATLNGVPFTKTIPFTYNTQLPVVASGSFDLAGYDFDLSSTGGFNQLPINYHVKFNDSGNPTLTTETFSISSSFTNLTIKRVFGNFGIRNITVSADSSSLSIFTNSNAGTLHFEDPSIQFLISNSFGMPLDAHITTLYAHSNSGNTNITGFPDPVPVNTPSAIGQTANTSFTLNNSNSNIAAAMGVNPKYIGYNAVATSNIPFSLNNFLEDSSRFKVDVRVELPLYGYADGLTITDTVDFHLENIKEVEWATFRTNITNGFPMDANTQIYFTDSSFTILDSLISPNQQIITSGLVDVNLMVYQPTLKTTDQYFPHARLQHIYNAKKIIIRAVLNSTNAPNNSVKIYSDYTLDVRLGVQAQLKMDIQ